MNEMEIFLGFVIHTDYDQKDILSKFLESSTKGHAVSMLSEVGCDYRIDFVQNKPSLYEVYLNASKSTIVFYKLLIDKP